MVVAGPEGWDRAPARRRRGHRRPGVALGILTADCAPVLLGDPEARVIGAAHAGWRGALDGVLEATLDAMERLGARAGAIRAAVGPTISQRAYEVGPEFFDRFRAEEAGYERFFVPGRGDRLRFDLPGFVLGPAARRRRRRGRLDRRLHLFRPGALLLLPPHHPRRRARLRAADLRDPPLKDRTPGFG